MSIDDDRFGPALDQAKKHALAWLDSVPTRPVGPRRNVDELVSDFGGPLQNDPIPAADVVDELARLADPGLMAMPSGRFFGWVIGGTLPAALGADWLVSAWDQNSAMRYATPATAAIEETAARWIVDLFGFPADSGVGFTTGAPRWRTSSASPAAARRCCTTSAGTSTPTGSPAPPASR